MATPRRLLVDPATCGVFHCVSRCVRRAFLCGWDAYSGHSYEHRRVWIRDRLRDLSGLFAIEVHAYAVMSNHLHVVVRTLPGRAGAWDDAEVARRWLWLFPGTGGKSGQPPEDSAIRDLCRDVEKLATCRARLADLSWFMRCLNEPVARRANREDECTGRFWEGRFKCQKLDDEGAALACMAYVDLNPVRAGVSATPEQSDFTSAQDRAASRLARRQLARAPQDPTPEQGVLIEQARVESTRDHWLAPIGPLPENQGGHQNRPGPSAEAAHLSLPQPASQPVIGEPPPLLTHLSEEHYLELLDWTGRQLRSGKRDHIPPELRPVLERLHLDVQAWVDNVERFGGLFYRLAGKLKRLKELAGATGRAWLHGHRGARRLYAEAG